MLRSNQLVGFGQRRIIAPGGEDPIFERISSADSPDNLLTYTFPGMALGADTPGREVFVVAQVYYHSDRTGTIVGVDIGGVAATLDAVVGSSYSEAVCCWRVMSGTSADVVVKLNNAGGSQALITVFRLVRTIKNVAAIYAASVSSASPTTHSNVTIPAGGFIISGNAVYNASGATPYSIAGLSSVIHDQDEYTTLVLGIGGSPGLNVPGATGDLTWTSANTQPARVNAYIYAGA